MASRIGFVALIVVLLTGCLQSRMPLFDETKAVTPAAAGRYEQQISKYGKWEAQQTGILSIEAKSYNWKTDEKEAGDFFTVYDIGGGFFIVAARRKNPSPEDPYTYALFEAAKEGFLAYTPDCSDMMKLRLPQADLPVIDGTSCFYTDRDALVRSLRTYAQFMLPSSRYVAVKP